MDGLVCRALSPVVPPLTSSLADATDILVAYRPRRCIHKIPAPGEVDSKVVVLAVTHAALHQLVSLKVRASPRSRRDRLKFQKHDSDSENIKEEETGRGVGPQKLVKHIT